MWFDWCESKICKLIGCWASSQTYLENPRPWRCIFQRDVRIAVVRIMSPWILTSTPPPSCQYNRSFPKRLKPLHSNFSRTIIGKNWNSPAQYADFECTFVKKESDGNMFLEKRCTNSRMILLTQFLYTSINRLVIRIVMDGLASCAIFQKIFLLMKPHNTTVVERHIYLIAKQRMPCNIWLAKNCRVPALWCTAT